MTTHVNRDELLQRAKRLMQQDETFLDTESQSKDTLSKDILSKDQIETELSLKENEFIQKLQEEWKKSQLKKSPLWKKQQVTNVSMSPRKPTNKNENLTSSPESSHPPPRKSTGSTRNYSPGTGKKSFPLLLKKQQQMKEKMHEIETQAQKLSHAIYLTMEKEEETKKALQKTNEESKQIQRELMNSMEESRQTIELLQEEIQDAQRKLDFESNQYNGFLKILFERRDQLESEYKTLTAELENEKHQKDAQQEALLEIIEKSKNQVVELSKRESELESKLHDHQIIFDELCEREEQALSSISSVDYSIMRDGIDELIQKMDKLQIQETNILLKLETYRQSYPKELEYIEKERQHQLEIQKLQKQKQELSEKRKNIQKQIDQEQLTLRDCEEKNEKIRSEFRNYKSNEDTYLEKKKAEMQTLRSFIQIRLDQVTELQDHVEYLESVYNDFQEQETTREQLKSMEYVVIEEEERKRLEKNWEKKSSELNNILQSLIISFNSEVQNFKNLKISSFQDLDINSIELKGHTIQSIRQAISRVKDYISSPEDIDLGQETMRILSELHDNARKLEFLKSQKEELTKSYVNRALKDGIAELSTTDFGRISSEDEERLAMYNRDIVVLEQEKIIFQRQMYQFWKNQLDEEQANINKQRFKLALKVMERLPSVDKSTLLLLETSAEVVSVKKKRLISLMQQIEKLDFEQTIKTRLLERWKSVHKLKCQDYTQKFVIQQAARKKYIEELKSIIQKEVVQLEDAQNLYEASDVEIREENLKQKTDNERQRLLVLSEEISNIEQRINELRQEKGQVEELLSEIHEKESKLEQDYEQIRTELEKKLAVDGDLALFESNERIETLRKLEERLVNIQEIIQRAYERSMNIVPSSSPILKSINIIYNSRQCIKDLQLKALETQRSLNIIAQDLKIVQKEKEDIEASLKEISAKEGKIFDQQVTTIEEKTFRRKQLEDMLQEIQRQEENSTQNFNNYAIPTRRGIEQTEEKIAELQAIIQRDKKKLQEEKQRLDSLQHKYHSQLNGYRGQRQHLKHRMELKTKALDNIQKGVDTMLTSENNEMVQTNPTDEKKSTYYRQYLKRKTNLPGFDVDNSLFDAVMNDPGIDDIPELSPIQRRTSTVSNDLDPGVETSTSISKRTLPQFASEVNNNEHGQKQESQVSEQETIRLFGPQSRPLTQEKVAKVIQRVQFMRQGAMLQKRQDISGRANSKNPFVSRFVYLSQELTRLEIKDIRKKVPESFIKIEHIKSLKSVNTSEGNLISLILRDKKVDFLTPDEDAFKLWYEGLKMLVNNKNNLFYLLYNLKEVGDGKQK